MAISTSSHLENGRKQTHMTLSSKMAGSTEEALKMMGILCLFTAVTAIKLCKALGKSHPKVIITIEGIEDGEIFDLIYYLKTYKYILEYPKLVVCLDSVAFIEETITVTSSLRGCITFDIKVVVAENNTYFGMGGSVIPSPYHIMNIF